MRRCDAAPYNSSNVDLKSWVYNRLAHTRSSTWSCLGKCHLLSNSSFLHLIIQMVDNQNLSRPRPPECPGLRVKNTVPNFHPKARNAGWGIIEYPSYHFLGLPSYKLSHLLFMRKFMRASVFLSPVDILGTQRKMETRTTAHVPTVPHGIAPPENFG